MLPEIKGGSAEFTLSFTSEEEMKDWIIKTGAVPFATYGLGTRELYLVQGRIVELRVEPPQPRQTFTSVEISGDIPPEARKALE